MADILIVDDDLDTAEAVTALLESRGHAVRTASTGEEGLRSLASAPLPNLVVLDVEMPVTSRPIKCS